MYIIFTSINCISVNINSLHNYLDTVGKKKDVLF